MPRATVTHPFLWRTGHRNILIEKGPQELTPEQLAHAEKHGFLQPPAKKTTPSPEVTHDE